MITKQKLDEILNYDPLTGLFTWRVSLSKRTPVGSVAGTVNDRGYIRIAINGKGYKAHHLAWLTAHGVWPKGDVDHRDTDSSNNAILNLRLATKSQNSCNRRTMSNNTSGFKGVIFIPKTNNWQARVYLKGKCKTISGFSTAEEASKEAQRMRVVIHGEFARE